MNKILLLFFAMIPFTLFAQESATEDVQEVVSSKDELFSKTKMFISDKWNNPKRSVINEDKDGGIIQVKTTKEFSINVGMGLKCVYEYEYLTKFRFKDNKYKVEIYDIKCLSAAQEGLGKKYDVPMIPYFIGKDAPETKKMGRGISEKKAIEMMDELRQEFQTIIKLYNKNITQKEDDF